MASKLIWTGPALADLKELTDYIRTDSPRYAAIKQRRIREVVENMKKFPFSFTTIPDLGREDIRQAFEGDYRIVVRVDDLSIHVLRVLHIARDLLRHFDPTSN